MTFDLKVEQREPRLVQKFTWEAVDQALIKRMLEAAYLEHNQDDDVENVRELEGDRLVRQAGRTLGRPLSRQHMTYLGPVLRDYWLPTLAKSDLQSIASLAQLGLTGPDRHVGLRSKGDLVEFLRRRRMTERLQTILHRYFVQLHKWPSPASGRGGWGGGRSGSYVGLTGDGAVDRRKPFDHQRVAWRRLDEMMSAGSITERAGLLVLPTGSGKTYTVVAWLLKLLEQDPTLRVLWLADQQELVNQAALTLRECASYWPKGESRNLRVVHGGAGLSSALGDPDVDVLCATRQSVIGRGFAVPAQRRLEAFLARPTVVVVDEARHAVSPTYRQLLDFVQQTAAPALLLGLTATPWPSGAGMTALLRERFPVSVANVQPRELVRTGVLAKPYLHIRDTGETVDLTPEQVRQIDGRDVPADVLRLLDRRTRNEQIVDMWMRRQEEWGKTLVFACDIEHAEHLYEAFRAAGAPAHVLHSRTDTDRRKTLEDFRGSQGPCVLVSVGMLREGVDIPDARTAFLARPTASRILMRQMIGRVLRGVAGGGEEVAHIVDLRDRWSSDVDILSPVDIPDLPYEVVTTDGGEHRLPPVLDEDAGEPISEDILERIARAYREVHSAVPYAAALRSTELVGFYELGYHNVPVFAHALARWRDVIEHELRGEGYRRPSDRFDDLPVPQPVVSDIRAVIQFCRSDQQEPPLVHVRATMSLAGVAQRLRDAGPLSEEDRIRRLRTEYESTLARSAFQSFHQFYDAYQQEVLTSSGEIDRVSSPEEVDMAQAVVQERPTLRRRSSRDLAPLVRSVATHGRNVLDEAGYPDEAELLRPRLLPPVEWTDAPIKGAWAYWNARLQGPSRGRSVIRINVALQAPRTQISDELLEYLIWHELLHHVLPGHNHDAKFRRLEAEWPGFPRLEHELDTTAERFDLSRLFTKST